MSRADLVMMLIMPLKALAPQRAALGPRMLELAGRRVAGTSVGQCGPRTVACYVAPSIRAAAEAAGRPEPRIVALVRLCVTDDHGPAFALAQATAQRYRQVPSYAKVQDMEALDEPADIGGFVEGWRDDRQLDGPVRAALGGRSGNGSRRG